jgi:hypothetical protein
LIKQLKSLLVTRLPGGGLRFASAQRRGEHDDFPKTLMLLCEKFARDGSQARSEKLARMRVSPTGAVYSESSISCGYIPHVGLVGAERRWYRRNADGTRTRTDAPQGTPEYERARDERLAKGMHNAADIADLGEAEVFKRLGINRTVR